MQGRHTGLVQGIGIRADSHEVADRLGLCCRVPMIVIRRVVNRFSAAAIDAIFSTGPEPFTAASPRHPGPDPMTTRPMTTAGDVDGDQVPAPGTHVRYFGDFELLFPAAILGLGIQDVPIRYGERTYGTTNISRFLHGWMLLRMTVIGFARVKLGRAG